MQLLRNVSASQEDLTVKVCWSMLRGVLDVSGVLGP